MPPSQAISPPDPLHSKEVAACPSKDIFGPEDDDGQMRYLGTLLAGLYRLCSQKCKEPAMTLTAAFGNGM